MTDVLTRCVVCGEEQVIELSATRCDPWSAEFFKARADATPNVHFPDGVVAGVCDVGDRAAHDPDKVVAAIRLLGLPIPT